MNEFDLVITDMTMPGIVGSELTKRSLDIRPDIPIICSGSQYYIFSSWKTGSENLFKKAGLSASFHFFIPIFLPI